MMTRSLKRCLSFLLCVAMVLAMLPVAVFAETGNNLYLKPNSLWLEASARFAAYFYNSSGDTWVSAQQLESDTGIYVVTIPSGYESATVIWCRMNPATTDNNWDNKWGQTADLSISGDYDLYTITDGSWSEGSWGVYTPTDDGGDEPVEPVSITAYCIDSNSWGSLSAHAWIEGGAGTAWPGAQMTKTGDTVNGFDVYQVTFDVAYENIIFNNNGNGAQTDNLTFNDGQYYDLKSGTWYASLADVPAVDPLATDYYLAGGFNGWSTTANEFKLDAEGSSVGYISLELDVNTTYEFKVIQAGSWTGCATTIIGDVSGLAFSSSDNTNCKITTAAAGTYVFAFDISGSTLSVTYPASVCTHAQQETVAGYAATCTTPGLTDGAVCASCGATLTAQEEIPATGHTDADGDEMCDTCGIALYMTIYFQNNWLWTDIYLYYWGSTTAPGAEWPGTAMELRGNDGTYDVYALKVPTDISGMKITGTKDDGTGATDGTPDITSGWYDGICYYMTWSDGNQAGSEDITSVIPCFHQEEIIPGTAPSCSSTGLTDGVKCGICGETLTAQEVIPATGHTEGEPVTYPLSDPTCIDEGSQQVIVYCTVCGGEVSNTIEPIPATGVHTEEIVPGYAASCNDTGLTDGVYCIYCGETLTAQEEIPATGVHADEDGDGWCDGCGGCMEHSYEEGYYDYDETGHYPQCNNCWEVDWNSPTDHEYDDDSDYVCDVCNYNRCAHNGTFSWGQYTYGHMQLCDICGQPTTNMEPHSDGDDADTLCDGCGFETATVTVYFDNTDSQWETVRCMYRLEGNGYWQSTYVTTQDGDLHSFEIPANAALVRFQNYVPGQPESEVPGGYQAFNSAVVDGKTYVYAAYTVTISETVNGTVAANRTTSGAGNGITLTVAVAEGYELDQLTVTSDTGTVEVTDNGDGTYFFTMPAGNVTVSATFKCANHTDVDADGLCDNCEALLEPAVLHMASLLPKGSIGIQYYMLLSDEVLADETAYMQFTMADGTVSQIPVSQGVEKTYNGKTYYVFTCAVDAKEMTDDVLCQFFYDGGATEEKAYNVKAYADYILANSTDAELKALVTTMLHYGAASQTQFGYNTDSLANAGLTAADVSGVSFDDFAGVPGQGTDLATLYGATLILKSETTLRFFFQVDESVESFSASYNGQALEIKQRGSLYYADVVGISAKDLDEDVILTISDGTNTANVSYNPMAYCAAVYGDDTGTYSQEMKDLVAALFLYNQAANVYLEEN